MNAMMLMETAYHPPPHQHRSKHRSLPKQPKDHSGSRSKSLSRKEEEPARSGRKKSSDLKHLSSSTNQLCVKDDSVEVPVIVDEVTKWISGINKHTTCRDIITVLLKRQGHFKVKRLKYTEHKNQQVDQCAISDTETWC